MSLCTYICTFFMLAYKYRQSKAVCNWVVSVLLYCTWCKKEKHGLDMPCFKRMSFHGTDAISVHNLQVVWYKIIVDLYSWKLIGLECIEYHLYLKGKFYTPHNCMYCFSLLFFRSIWSRWVKRRMLNWTSSRLSSPAVMNYTGAKSSKWT